MTAATLSNWANGNSPTNTNGTKSTSTIVGGLVAIAARFGEIGCLMLAGAVHAGVSTSDQAIVQAATFGSAISALVATSLYQGMGTYTRAALLKPHEQLGRLVLGWSLAVVIFGAALTITGTGETLGTPWLLTWFLFGAASIATVRVTAMVATRAMQRSGTLARNAIVYGSGGSAQAVIHALMADASSDIRVAGMFDDRLDERAAAEISPVPHLGNVAALKSFVRSNNVDVVILALPLAAEARVTMLVQRLADLPVDVRLAATASTLQLAPSAYSYVGSVPMIDLADRPISGWSAIAKRLFDLVIASLAIIVLAPVMALVAVAVRYESAGPAIFRQKRYGFNNELVEVFKYRSMYTDRSDATASKLVTKDDPRVTRVGRVIRKTSLDELPQLFNVLLGTLSLVGPRPHAVQAKAADRLYPDVVDLYFARHNVKPGITGWAQINGWRGETDTTEKIEQRVAYDLDYISRWSVGFDLYILAKTPISLLKTENAY
jgi:Undecaprenyl-phosphate glucose phosphotransferase